uniref:Uncharacterized protein n=1 Tax=Glossina austeni TaxID=7395 RepID=A0A1A9VSR9_GLOAU
MHNNFDIVTPGDRDTILSKGTDNGALTVELMLGITTAEAEVRKLPIAYRKCRYTNENNLNYFRDSTRFESTVIVKVLLPRMGFKRRVVFSADQLIVSFGGAIGLFLGASFISVYGLVFTFSQFVFSNISSLCKKCFRNSN